MDRKDKVQNLLGGIDQVQNLSAKSFGWKRKSTKFVRKIFWMEKIKCKICQQILLDGKDKLQNLLDGEEKVQNFSAKSFGWKRESAKCFGWKR